MSDDQLWQVRQGRVVGCPVGSVVELTRDGGSLRISKPGVGVMVTLDARTTEQSTLEDGQDVLIRNRTDGFEAVLTPYDPGAHVAAPALEGALEFASNRWTSLAVLRQYGTDKRGQDLFALEVEVFGRHDYSPMTQSTDGGHVHVGRLLMTSGLSVFAGKRGIRSDGTITVTFQRAPAPQPAPVDRTDSDSQSGRSRGLDALAMLEKLGQLRDAGVLSAEEFETKKGDLLGRL